MNAQDFAELTRKRQEYCDRILNLKGEEYSRNGERLHNFYRTAAMNNETPEQALWGMLSKHIISVMDIVEDTAKGKVPDIKVVDEKIGDFINYGHLLEGLLEDRRGRKGRLSPGGRLPNPFSLGK